MEKALKIYTEGEDTLVPFKWKPFININNLSEQMKNHFLSKSLSFLPLYLKVEYLLRQQRENHPIFMRQIKSKNCSHPILS